jgi:hypothetical protein
MLSLAVTLTVTNALRADDITEALDNARKAYEDSNYSEAIQQSDYAATLIRQKKSDAVAKQLPQAPTGWNADEVEVQGGGQAILGGLAGAKRSYHRDDGSSVTIEIQCDSPLIQTIMPMFSNPALLGGTGSKLENIKGQKIVVTFKNADKSGEIKAIVDNRYLVSLNGNELTRDELLSFAKAIDFKALSALR